jgi:hypothetical protein
MSFIDLACAQFNDLGISLELMPVPSRIALLREKVD